MTDAPPRDALIDEASLGAWLDERLGAGALEVTRHRAGHSNETFFVDHGARRMVLRRPPRGAFLPTAHDVEREYRVLSALQGSPVRVPRTVLVCTTEDVIGAPFYLMERVQGVVVRTAPPAYLDAVERRRVGEELVDALVELHSVDVEACGLGGFGKPGYLERQLRRWRGQMELTLPSTRPLPDLEALGVWLADNLPPSQDHTLVHGDYKLDNVMFSAAAPARLLAILDWEMSTLGDPLADLGWMISFWLESDDPSDDLFAELNRVTALEGFPSRSELVTRYAEATGRNVGALDWYRVLATWKLAILLEGSYARHLAGATDDPFFARMEAGVPALALRGRAVAGI